MKNLKMSNNPAIYEVLTKQYLHSILDISVLGRKNLACQQIQRYDVLLRCSIVEMFYSEFLGEILLVLGGKN